MTDSARKIRKKNWHWIVLLTTIIGTCVLLWIYIYQDITDKKELNLYQRAETFSRIYDIAHQEINETWEENPFTTEELKRRFYEIDNKLHTTKNTDEKNILEDKMVDLLQEVEKGRPIVKENKESDLEKDNEYRELLEQFNKFK